MVSAELPENESQRLAALNAHELLDTKAESSFDAVTKLAANVFGVPICAVSLIDADRQWFKSRCGLRGPESTSRDISFCSHTILQTGVFEVPDATTDPRFADNPLVTGYPRKRFYAAAPLIDPQGMALGALCLIDHRPRRLTPEQKEQLEVMAQAVVGIIIMRIRPSELREYARYPDDIRHVRSTLHRRRDDLKRLADEIHLVDQLSSLALVPDAG